MTDLAPLEGFAAARIRSIDLRGNAVTELDALARLRFLERVDLRDNPVSDLAPLGKVPRLLAADLRGTRAADGGCPASAARACRFATPAAPEWLSDWCAAADTAAPAVKATVDLLKRVAGTTDCRSLETALGDRLKLDDLPVGSLEPVGSLRGVRFLSLARTGITDLAPLAGMTQLVALDVSGNAVTDLAPLSDFGNLRTFNASDTQVADLAPLGHLVDLTSLSLANLSPADLAPLDALEKLVSLNVTALKGITAGKVVEHHPKLVWLWAGANGWSDVTPLGTLESLKKLDLRGNHVTDLGPLTGLPNLEDLNASANDLASLPQTPFGAKLATLWLADNLLVDVTPLATSAVKTLSLSANFITDASALGDLRTLQSLDLRGNPLAAAACPIPAGQGACELSTKPTNFAGWCEDAYTYHRGLRRTVSALKALSGKDDCADAQAELYGRGEIDLSGKGLTDVEPFLALPNLKVLRLRGNDLGTIAPLAAHPALELLDARDNPRLAGAACPIAGRGTCEL